MYLVRGNDKLHFRMRVEVLEQYILILWPRRSCHENEVGCRAKIGCPLILLGLLLNGEHTVESGVATDGHIINIYAI